MASLTFQVSDHPVATEPCAPLRYRPSVEAILRLPVEAMALSDTRLVCCNDAHPFAQAAHDAFFQHYPLVISPDDVWFCLAQGFSHHVNLHAESLRHLFVQHQGTKKLVVERPDFSLGQADPWPEVFSSSSDQIAENVGRDLRDLVVADFSTTTEFHRAATEVLLMDTFQAYFEYELLCGCGIPAITLTGAPDDWRDIRCRAERFAAYGLEEWIAALLPVLDRIEATSRGHHDREFWNSFFRYRSGSFGADMTGWIHVLFPYLKDRTDKLELVPNPYFKNWQEDYLRSTEDLPLGAFLKGPYLSEIPGGLSSAPVRVIDLRTKVTHDMRFVAGMFGVAQERTTNSLSCAFGWAIVYDKAPVSDSTTPRKGRWSLRRLWGD